MATFTTRVKDICENQYLINNPGVSDDDLNNTISVCQNVHKNIFNFDYPLQDELKNDFEFRFLMHYYFQEIGQETYGVWKHYLAEKLFMISDTYNQLYKSINLEYDILNPLHYTEKENVNLGETTTNNRNIDTDTNSSGHTEVSDNGTETTNNTTTSQDSGNSNLVHKELRTPQNNLQNFLDGNYMSSATQDYGDTSANGTTTVANTVDHDNSIETDTENESNTTTKETADGSRNQTTIREREIMGKSDNVSQGDLILKYRETVLNLVEQLVLEFEDSFMLVYDGFDSQQGTFNNMILGGFFNGR